MSNLRLINETTAECSTTSLEITDVFSSDFDIYKIVSTLDIVNDSDDIFIRYINSAVVQK